MRADRIEEVRFLSEVARQTVRFLAQPLYSETTGKAWDR